ncbi:allophanate hydrolase [Endothiovibrio diazotrophicus]
MKLTIDALLAAYRNGETTPREVAAGIVERAAGLADHNLWITPPSLELMEPWLARLDGLDPASLPLYGIPFAIKDNIDLTGVPTSAGCAAFTYTPERSAFVVERLIEAGALPVGKANLDQFATGLVGVRSPWGATRNAFNPDYLSGGSSSGSAVAVAKGLAAFSLGTDTAGSGRVPAAFNNLVGIKGTRGWLSTSGVVPACRTLDCVTVFAHTVSDARAVTAVAGCYDDDDPYARLMAPGVAARPRFIFGVPREDQLEFFGDAEMERLFTEQVVKLESLGGEAVAIDFQPFLDAARLLYEGPWVAERYAAVQPLIESNPEALLPVTRAIIEPAAQAGAVAAFQAQYRLAELKRQADRELHTVDFIVTPTAGTIYTIAEVEADPIRLNANLGYYTNFMNLLDLAAVAVPAGLGANGLPYGVTLVGPACDDAALADYAARLLGEEETGEGGRWMRLAVCGAHMAGLPLNHQLAERGARLLERTSTAPNYRFYALPGGPPKRPGLVRVEEGGGAVEVELWELPESAFGSFMALVPAPLAIGSVELADGGLEKGFLCESAALDGAEEITALGGWRNYLDRGAE